jgi:hypothetical protein
MRELRLGDADGHVARRPTKAFYPKQTVFGRTAGKEQLEGSSPNYRKDTRHESCSSGLIRCSEIVSVNLEKSSVCFPEITASPTPRRTAFGDSHS